MELTEKNLDASLDLALKDLKKNLEPGERNTEIGKTEVLMKTREALKSGKIDLLTAGMIEGRVNKGISLDKTHRAALGLADSTKIEGLSSPGQSAPEARMGKTPGGSAAQIPTGTPLQENATVTAMLAKEKMIQTFQNMAGVVIKVSGSEILAKVRELVKKGAMTLTRAGDLERMVNTGAPVRPEILRAIFGE